MIEDMRALLKARLCTIGDAVETSAHGFAITFGKRFHAAETYKRKAPETPYRGVPYPG